MITLKFVDKSLEKKYLCTRWRETVLTNRKYSAFLVLNALILIIYEHFWKYNDTNVLLYRCIFDLIPLTLLLVVTYAMVYKLGEELSKKSVRIAWLYSAVRERIVNQYRLWQVGISLVFLSCISIYIFLPTGIQDAPFETIIMLVYLQLSISTGIGTSYFLAVTLILLIESLAESFKRPDASNYIVSILFSFVNAFIFIRLTAIKRRKLFIFESSEQTGLFSQLDSQVKSIETLSLEYKHNLKTLKRSGNSSSTDSSSRASENYKFVENVLSMYSDV